MFSRMSWPRCGQCAANARPICGGRGSARRALELVSGFPAFSGVLQDKPQLSRKASGSKDTSREHQGRSTPAKQPTSSLGKSTSAGDPAPDRGFTIVSGCGWLRLAEQQRLRSVSSGDPACWLWCSCPLDCCSWLLPGCSSRVPGHLLADRVFRV